MGGGEVMMGGVKPCDWNYETVNLADDPGFANTRATLSKALHAGWRSGVESMGAHADQRGRERAR
jgi:hypothetical protein